MSTQIERFTAMADKIREKTETTDKIIPNDFVNKIDDVYNKGVSDGKQSQYDLFWDNFQRYGNRKSYEYAFEKWDESAFYPKYNIKIGINSSGADDSGSATSAFRNFNSNMVNDIETNEPIDLAQRLEDCGVTLDTSLVTNFMYTFSFANISRLPTIDMSAVSNLGYMTFYYARKLETIDKIILKDDGSQTCNANVFQGLGKLKNITFEGVIGSDINFQWSTLLTKESITSIINALSDTTGATLTLSKTAVNNAFTADEWTTLKNSKSNWQITLV